MELIECINRIPMLLNAIAKDDRNEDLKHKLQAYVDGKHIKNLVVVASGTSLNAAKVTRYFAQSLCGINVTCVYPNIFLNYYDYLNCQTLYVFVSQGGSTKLVYQCLNKVKNNGYQNISITESLDSPIAKAADVAIEMGSEHEEFMYRTIGYSTTVATCMMIEMSLASINQTIDKQKENEILQDLNAMAANISTIIELTDSWYVRNKFSLLRRNKCVLAGTSYLWETANEADIKLMEMVPMMSKSFELEELIHGPQNSFDDDTLFFLLADKDFDSEKLISIKHFISNEIGFCSIVGNISVDERDLVFEYKSKYFRMLEEITVFQVLAYRIATDRGRDLTRGVNACVGKYIKKTL